MSEARGHCSNCCRLYIYPSTTCFSVTRKYDLVIFGVECILLTIFCALFVFLFAFLRSFAYIMACYFRGGGLLDLVSNLLFMNVYFFSSFPYGENPKLARMFWRRDKIYIYRGGR